MVMSKSVERRLKVQKGCECGEKCDCALPDESDIIMSNLVEKMLMEAIEKYHLIEDENGVKIDIEQLPDDIELEMHNRFEKSLPELMRKYGLKRHENDAIMKPLNTKPTEEIEAEMVDAFEQGVLPLVDHLKE